MLQRRAEGLNAAWAKLGGKRDVPSHLQSSHIYAAALCASQLLFSPSHVGFTLTPLSLRSQSQPTAPHPVLRRHGARPIQARSLSPGRSQQQQDGPGNARSSLARGAVLLEEESRPSCRGGEEEE